MILRHITNRKSLNNIIAEGCLNPQHNRRKHDRGFVSFELNPVSNFLVDNFHILKNWSSADTFELLFDGNKLEEHGYEIVDNIEGIRFNKLSDVGMGLNGHISFTDEDLEGIGDCRFIKGTVPLEFLIEDTKEKIEKWKKDNTQ